MLEKKKIRTSLHISMRPRIVLVGVGRFGTHHLEVLLALHREKKILLSGVVSKSAISESALSSLSVNVYTKLSVELLKQIDAVDIVTPVSTHYALVKKCLPYADVLVEKPLAMTPTEGRMLEKMATRYKKILAVGHIFRFNDATKRLQSLLKGQTKNLYRVEGRFTGGSGEPAGDCGVVTSDMHIVDVFEYLFGMPKKIYCIGWTRIPHHRFEDQADIFLEYGKGLRGYVQLGWYKAPKERSVTLYLPRRKIYADLLSQTITIVEMGKKTKIIYCYRTQPLRMELLGFIHALGGGKGQYVPATTANKVLVIVQKAQESMRRKKPIYVEKA